MRGRRRMRMRRIGEEWNEWVEDAITIHEDRYNIIFHLSFTTLIILLPSHPMPCPSHLLICLLLWICVCVCVCVCMCVCMCVCICVCFILLKVGIPGGVITDSEKEFLVAELLKMKCLPVFLEANIARAAYHGYCKQVRTPCLPCLPSFSFFCVGA